MSTVFLSLLCLTGLPLIFHQEIDELIGHAPTVATLERSQKATIDAVAEAALRDNPGSVLQYLSWDREKPQIVTAFTNKVIDGDPNETVVKAFDATTAQPIGLVGAGPMLIVLRLHVDLFAGLPGKLFLGAMGVLMVVAIVSGIVLYWPFTRRLAFGTLRRAPPRVRWLDWHNLLGGVTIVWALVVALTGTINAFAEPMLNVWKSTELAALAAPYVGKPPPAVYASLDVVLSQAAAALPEYDVGFIAFPGTPFTSQHHFAAFMRGRTTLTSRLLRPILLDGETGGFAASSELPFYLKALFVSQPLHFGDYGGMPLKAIWALLDMTTIGVLGSGLYLWIARVRRRRLGRGLVTPIRYP